MEKDAYCREVLNARACDGFFPKEVLIHDDVTTFDMSQVGSADGLTAGWPCQAWDRVRLIVAMLKHSYIYLLCVELFCSNSLAGMLQSGPQEGHAGSKV